ncbi:hypothetical protein BGZ61DRAFT_483343 [Ilyonectria robusta]|uniref:uncharacterized protein n=1 Tax=Ilyonectria robusta TaxID=1079257 RepID=UPI001E8E192B|nr:uncharacterized protein BGZ61DRAFT_483343 [Ilyonectria robusta]KAH8670058.1 hypothetical protein BGZ61DRAFT_483343 [Ilyonectria robusta]
MQHPIPSINAHSLANRPVSAPYVSPELPVHSSHLSYVTPDHHCGRKAGSYSKQKRKTYADIPGNKPTNPPTNVLSSAPSYHDKLPALPKCPLLTNPACPNPGPNLADASLWCGWSGGCAAGPHLSTMLRTIPRCPTSPSKYSILTLPQPIVDRSPPSGPSAEYAVLTTPLNSAGLHHHSCSRGIAESGGAMIKCGNLLGEWRGSSLVGLRRSNSSAARHSPPTR